MGGARSWVIVFVLGAAGCSDEPFELERLGELNVVPDAYAFIVDQAAAGGSAVALLEARNSGDGDLEIRELTLEGGDGVLALETLAPSAPIPAGGSLPIAIRYTRADDDLHEASLVVVSSDPRQRELRVPIAVQRGRAWLMASPERVAFARGETRRTLSLINVGNAPALLHQVRFAGDAGFGAELAGALVRSGDEPVTLDPPLTLAAGATLTVPLTSEATEAALATLIVFGDAENALDGFRVQVTSAVAGPCILVNPPRIVIGTKEAGTVSRYPVAIESCGDGALELTSIALAAATDVGDPGLSELGVDTATSPRLSLGSELPERLEPGARAFFDVVYTAADGASLDTGFLIVRSSSRIPVIVVPIQAETAAVPPPPPPPPPPTTIAGCTWTGGEVREHTVELGISGDDTWEGWVDGAAIPRPAGSQPWNVPTWHVVTLTSGCHTVTLHAWDLYAVTSGVIAVVKVDGVVRWVSGDARPEWHVSGPDAPPGDWHALTYDDDSWPSPAACSDSQPWAGMPYDLQGLGARWAWWNDTCRDLSNAYFRLVFTVD